MNNHLRISLVLVLLSIAATVTAEPATETTSEQAIEALKGKEFRPNRVGDRLTLEPVNTALSQALAHKRGEERKRLYEEMTSQSSGQSRSEGITPYTPSYDTAKLGANAAVALAGTTLILAILGYPWDIDSNPDYVFALFDKNTTTSPLCLSVVKLMVESEGKGFYFWGNLRSMAARPAGTEGYFIQTNMSGGDSGGAWTSPMFMHMDKQCEVTMLAQFYEFANYGGEGGECSGKTISGHFVSNSQIELTTQKASCHPKTKEPVLRPFRKQRYDLNALRQDPKRRIFQPR